MITTVGKQNLIRIAAGLQGQFVSHIAVGIGNTAAVVGDTRLDYEVLRIPVSSATPDFVGNTVIYKGTIPAEVALDAYEVGLVSSSVAPNTLISDFTEEAGFWTVGSLSTLNSRVAGGTLLLAPAASALATSTAVISADWSLADDVVVSYFVGANVASAVVRFMTDASNHYSFSLPVTAGYKVTRIPKASFTATGTPAAINSIQVTATATGGGAAAMYYDSISFADTSDRAPELVARRVLVTNLNKPVGVARDIEYSLAVATA